MPPAARKVVEAVGDDVGRRLTLRDVPTVHGTDIRQYTLFLRMTKAAQEIERVVKIDAVTLLVGFRSRKNFYRQFETWFSVKPTDLRDASRARSNS
jgi:AraC-like DNA-binding protein